MTGCCGLVCTECECFIATKENDDTKRAEVAVKWSTMYESDIKPEDINCDGCRSNGKLFHYCENMCEIRKCCEEKELDNCSSCDDYACEKLTAFFGMVPQAKTTLDALRS